MKLLRVRLEQFRQFRQPLEITDLQPGLNLFTGENEAGKSTIAMAIRTAFFERHRSGSVEHLRPWGDSAASPSVTLEFMIDERHHRLTKSFLSRKRCELQIGPRRLDGMEAENHLASLLGFEHAGKGASKAEHWGIPGLLWIEQGAGAELRAAVANAADHLRSALNESLGEVASSGGDEVLASVEAMRNELLTPASGAPRGPFAEARKREATLAEELTRTDGQIDTYRRNVDTLAALREAHTADEIHQPWVAFRKQQRSAEQALEAIEGLQKTLGEQRQRAAVIDDTLALLHSRLESFAVQERDLARRRSELDTAYAACARAEGLVLRCQDAHAQARQRDDLARTRLRHARQQHSKRTLGRELDNVCSDTQRLGDALSKAEAHQGVLLRLQKEAGASDISAEHLQTLRRQRAQLYELGIRQQAAATRLSFALAADRSIHIGKEPVGGSGERLLLDATAIILPGLGSLHIAPGGTDLAQLKREEAHLADQHAATLQLMAVDSLEAAEQRQQTHAQLQTEIKAATAALKALAPQGTDALRAQLARHEARAAEIEDTLRKLSAAPAGAALPGATASMPTAPDSKAALPNLTSADTPSSQETPSPDATPLSIEQAEAEEEASRRTLAQTGETLTRAQGDAARTHSAQVAAQRELAQLQVLLEAPQRAQELKTLQQQLIEARAQRSLLDELMKTLDHSIAQARPDVVRQDVERYRSSAKQQEAQFHERRERLLRLEGELESAGASGLEEHRAELARDHAQAARRTVELQRRAAALDHLLNLLKDKRRALTRRLQAPLQKHLNHYLQLLFPNAHLEIDEDLSPGPLTRSNTHQRPGDAPGGGSPIGESPAGESSDFESLSFGAREQMGLISRLAYADLLKEAGNPTLIILDDALVHSDESRLARMKRILFDAATRHQILLFTCHPQRWRDLGVAARDLQSLRLQS